MSITTPFGIYRDLFAFVRKPHLPEPRQAFGWAWARQVLWLALLDLSLSLILLIPLSRLSQQLKITEPDFSAITSHGLLATLALGALAIPALEELVFRFWLDGRRRSVLVVLAGLLPAAVLFAASKAHLGMGLRFGFAAIGLIVPLVLLIRTRGKPSLPAPWFTRNFAWFYFGSALAFALAHVSNYPMDRLLLVLPFVLPQMIAGLILGFARVRFGYAGGLAIHALANGTAFALMAGGA